MFRYIIVPLIIIALLIAGWLYIGPGEPVLLRIGDLDLDLGDKRNAMLALAAAIAAIIALWTLIVWLWQLPGRIKSGLGLRKRDQALTAMEEALLAGAEGNPALARKKAERARNLIQSPRLGRIISAQAAEACGDHDEALAQYTAMLDDPRTVPTAQRGLAQQYMSAGDYASAIEHAHLAYSQNKDARWAFDTLFRAQIAAHDWVGALDTLSTGESRKHVDADVALRRRAAIETALADRWEEAGRAEEARELVVAAAARDPEFAPAVALATRLLTRVNETRRARKLIEAAWVRRPHPALGFAYRDVVEGQKPGVKNLFSRKSIESLIAINPDHRESHLLEVEQAIAAENYVEAWGTLSPLLNGDDSPSSRLCLLAARCETGLGNTSDARLWMERAATAPTEGDWSDMDPSGDAFIYADPDWHRLILAYGDRAELVHPRLDANAPTRLALSPTPEIEAPITDPADIPVAVEEAATSEAKPTLPKPDADIAERLDKLLDD